MKTLIKQFSCFIAMTIIGGMFFSCYMFERTNENDPKSPNYRPSKWSVTVTNAPSNLEEESNESRQIGIKLASIADSDFTLTVASSNAAITCSGASSVDLAFTPANSLVEQYVTLAAVTDPNAVSEWSTISITSEFTKEVSFNIRAVDKDAVNIVLSGSGTLAEGGTGTIGVKLTKDPVNEITVNLVSSIPGSVSLGSSSVVFTQANYGVVQNITTSGIEDANDVTETAIITATAPGLVDMTHDIATYDNDTTVVFGGATSVDELSTATITVKLSGNPGVQRIVDLSSSIPASLTISPDQLTFNPGDATTEQEVTVIGEEDANMTGESVVITASGAGVVTKTQSVSTVDVNAPMSASFSPSNGSSGIAPDANIVITFSEGVETADNGWSVVAGGITYSNLSNFALLSWSGDTQLTINPASDFTRGSQVVVGVSGFIASFDGYTFGSQNISYRIGTIVTYDGNTNTGGSPPTDGTANYSVGQTVTVLGQGTLTKTNYSFAGWNTQTDGKGTTYWNPQTFPMGTSNVTLYAKWTYNYSLRDTGPGGGLVFYDKGSYSNGWRYLEAAASDQSTAASWGDSTGNDCDSYLIPGADGTAVGTGNQNTIDIDNYCSSTLLAAHICINLVTGGYSDWFLPSKDELGLMYTQLKAYSVGGFSSGVYWSSSESGTNIYAWYYYFSDGSTGTTFKSNQYYVRAVRAF
ncbi:MAG: DUF1566 domain-containing protein [Spirochaetes bacterium]|nr:MAG: DUF1566 domain-containing protein [Spirochaetota bacterium]